MRKKILFVVIAVCLLCGCSKTIPKLSNGDEAVVSFTDGSMISVNDLYEKLKETYSTEILVEMIDTKILEDKYSKKLTDADEYADNYIESIKTYYTDESGNYDESSLLAAINQYYGYSSLDDFKTSVRLNYLRNLVVEDYAKTKITDSQINKYYKSDIVGDREISHIEIIPDVTDDMTDDEKTAKEEEALKTAKEVITKLKKGEKFDDLAEEYSDDSKTDLGSINKGDYGSDEFDEEAWSLKVGSYSTTPVKTSSGYEIIYVKSESEKKSLEDVKDDIIETLADELIEEDATIQVTALKEIRKEYGVDIVDDEINSNYNKYMNNLYDNALTSNNSAE